MYAKESEQLVKTASEINGLALRQDLTFSTPPANPHKKLPNATAESSSASLNVKHLIAQSPPRKRKKRKRRKKTVTFGGDKSTEDEVQSIPLNSDTGASPKRQDELAGGDNPQSNENLDVVIMVEDLTDRESEH